MDDGREPLVIDEHRVVSLHYRLDDGFGEPIDDSSGAPPLVYMHNTDAILPSLERELTGRVVGDVLEVTIYPEDAYGYVDEDLVQAFSRETLGDLPGLAVGQRVRARGPGDDSRLASVREIDEDNGVVVLDANHPLAGRVLHFVVTIVAVREPTPDELERGAASSAQEALRRAPPSASGSSSSTSSVSGEGRRRP